MNHDKLTAVMQFALTIVFTVGFFAVAFIVTLGRAEIAPELIRLADTLFGGMLAILTQQSAYWFARQRNAVAQG
jgi:hypothetical protein